MKNLILIFVIAVILAGCKEFTPTARPQHKVSVTCKSFFCDITLKRAFPFHDGVNATTWPDSSGFFYENFPVFTGDTAIVAYYTDMNIATSGYTAKIDGIPLSPTFVIQDSTGDIGKLPLRYIHFYYVFKDI